MSQNSLRFADLYEALRLFCLGCFFDISREIADGAVVDVELLQHWDGDLALFQYNEKVDSFVEERAERLLSREDAVRALMALKAEPAIGIIGQGHLVYGESEDTAIRRSILLPLLVDVVESCGSFDWSDSAFNQAYGRLEERLFSGSHSHRAVVPLVGLVARDGSELGSGVRVRSVLHGELSIAEQQGLLPDYFGREPDRCLVIEIETTTCKPVPPNTPEVIGWAVSALRLTVPGAIAVGPAFVEFLDGGLYGVRETLDLSRQIPTGEPTRLDNFRSRISGEVFSSLSRGIEDPVLIEALDRWELALFHSGPLRAEGLRESLVQLLGEEDGAWAAAMRAAALVGETPDERAKLMDDLVALVEGNGPGVTGEDVLRRALIACLRSESRVELLSSLDSRLLGFKRRTGSATHCNSAIRKLAASR